MQNYIVINSSKLTDNKWLSSFLSNLNYAWQTVCKTGPIWRIHDSPQERRTNMTWNQKTESPRQTSKRPFSTYNWVYLLGSYWYIALTLAIKLYDISLTIFKNGFRLGNRALIKMSSYQYRKSHCGNTKVVRSSYLHKGISYTGKMASLYWTNPLGTDSI